MSSFDKWFRTTMLPAECDDERVIEGMRLCWNDALLHAAEVAAEECDEDSGSNAYFYNMACYNIAGALRKEVLDILEEGQ